MQPRISLISGHDIRATQLAGYRMKARAVVTEIKRRDIQNGRAERPRVSHCIGQH